MLSLWFQEELYLRIAQALIAGLFALLVVLLVHWQSIRLEKEIVIAVLRSLVQITLVGSVLIYVLTAPTWLGVFILGGMIASAAVTAARRTKEIPGSMQATFFAILLGSGSVIGVMTFLGVIQWEMASLLPVGSMIVSGGMNSCALALDRFKGEIDSHVGHIEAGLSLGASSKEVVKPYVRKAFHASLIPRINSMRALGIVWIPGIMSGMLLAGSDPIYAALYQFVVMSMLFVASSLSSLISILFVRKYIFSAAEQLILRSEGLV